MRRVQWRRRRRRRQQPKHEHGRWRGGGEGMQAIKGRVELCANIYNRFKVILLILLHADETKGVRRILFESIETELRFVFGCVS
jgi:hypothetical protein